MRHLLTYPDQVKISFLELGTESPSDANKPILACWIE